MNYIDGYLNRKFMKKRLEKYLKQKEIEYKKELMIINNKKDMILK
jgi:hypothetical protein